MVFVRVRENDNIVDKSAAIVAMFFQCSIHKTLCIRRGVRITYKIDIGTFYSLLANEDKTIFIVGIYYKLKKEVRYIDDYKIFLSSNRIDDLLLQGQRVAI